MPGIMETRGVGGGGGGGMDPYVFTEKNSSFDIIIQFW